MQVKTRFDASFLLSCLLVLLSFLVLEGYVDHPLSSWEQTFEAFGLVVQQVTATALHSKTGISAGLVAWIQGPMTISNKVFDGTLSELTPSLLAYSAEMNTTSLLMSGDQEYWALVRPPGERGCQSVSTQSPVEDAQTYIHWPR
jgi:hypothetical protein